MSPVVPPWAIRDHEIDDILPQSGWVSQYVEYARNLTDAPVVWHWATCLSILGSTIADEADLVIGSSKGETHLPLSMWVAIIGPSGERKSTALRIGKRIYDRANSGRGTLPNDGSVEALVDTLTHTPAGLYFREELTQLMASQKKNYTEALKDTLIELHSGQTYVRSLVQRVDRTKKKSSFYEDDSDSAETTHDIKVARPRVGILGAIPNGIFGKTVTQRDWESGFVPRFMLVASQRERRQSLPAEDLDGETRLAGMLHDLKRSMHSKPKPPYVPFSIAQYISETVNEWVDGRRHLIHDHLYAHFVRYQNLALQIAGLYATSNWMGDRAVRRVQSQPQVTREDARRAIAAIQLLADSVFELVGDTSGDAQVAEENSVANAYRLAGERGLSVPEAWSRIGGITRYKVYQVTKLLLELGEIEEVFQVMQKTGSKKGRKATRFRYVEGLDT